jgi:hypothetical protein
MARRPLTLSAVHMAHVMMCVDMADGTTARRAHHGMMMCEMARHCAYRRTFKTTARKHG